ncbi:nucleotidyltransferase domain-containing protein [Nitratifractor salsuginis]|uniref:nucleotidyltransferase domain-containing protein n=1 Tax=Nitratifractor salsuginis TaxID=269261 RepID=UPI0005A727C0|nr:nucleotidyltransferase family protein [Nitratifractor salsuginis]
MHTLSRELRLLIACCQAKPSQDDIDLILDTIRDPKFDIQNLLELSSRHGVLPLVYKNLKAIEKSIQTSSSQNDTPPTQNPKSKIRNLLIELKPRYFAIVQRNILMSAELIKIFRLLRENDIEVLAFKGPTLAQIAYGDITLRQFGDLDILIHRKDFRKIASQMTEKGYEPRFPIETFTGDKVMFEMNNDCPFYDRKRGLAIEIHWDFFRKLALSTQKLQPWEETAQVTINGSAIPTLRYETHLLYHSLHGSKHIWERMCWIVDIDRFIRNVPDLDWDDIIDRAKELGALRMFLLGPALARYFFNTPLPEKIEKLCRQARFDNLIAFVVDEFKWENPTPEDSLVKLKKVIALRDNLYYKTFTLLEFLFRPGINERRTIVLADNLFWLYWPLRPIGMVYRFLFCRLMKLCEQRD